MEKWQDPSVIFLWLGIAIVFVAFLGIAIGLLTRVYFKKITKADLLLTETKLEHQKTLTTTSVEILERERNRIAIELHDAMTSKLHRILLLSVHKDKKEQLQKITEECIILTRTLSHDLRPPLLEHLSLNELFDELLKSLYTTYTIKRINDQRSILEITADQKLHILRVTQEVINNIIKHAEASVICFHQRITATNITIRIKDDGKGYDPEQLSKGLGFRNIELRLQILQGYYKFKSGEGEDGTTFLMQISLIQKQ